ncbi:TIGR04222 domain-containing membrane protein [Streptomyces sp. NPDC048696]|uniref:TIGR04222 domain-containing membrane protein n=1 Tax=Streptomyces sp. NPDC048696 TaxID=3365585 RepID=UPI00371A1466
MWWFIGAAGIQLIIAAALLRPAPARRATLDAVAAACVRGGPRAAVTVALAGLHLSGTVDADPDRPGAVSVRVDELPVRLPDPLQHAVATSLRTPMDVRAIIARPRVRQAVGNLLDGLTADGLLRRRARWTAAQILLAAVPLNLITAVVFGPRHPTVTQLAVTALALTGATALLCLPRRTPAAHALLVSLRAAHPLPMTRPRPPDGEILMLVALHGDRALAQSLPRFAREAGLLARGGGEHGGRNPLRQVVPPSPHT